MKFSVFSGLWKKAVSKNAPLIYFPLRLLFSIVSCFYSLVLQLRNWAYQTHILSVKKLPFPVLSIGNLSLGGSGKTTLALYCAQFFLSEKKLPAVLSRGYRRKTNENTNLIVSDGTKILENFENAGDEPSLIARSAPRAKVVVGSNRFEAAKTLLQKTQANIFILDDGFQHRQLYRNLDIVCLDDSIFNSPYLFPRGVLREKSSALQRADFVLVKTEFSEVLFLQKIKEALGFSIRQEIAFFDYAPDCLIDNTNAQELELSWIKNKKVIALSAIAKPEHFEKILKNSGSKIVECFWFEDHHYFSKQELQEVLEKAKAFEAVIVMTEKDRIKVPGNFPAYALKIKINWKSGEEQLKKKIAGFVKK